MTFNPLMSRKPVIVPDRPTPTKTMKTGAWNRENGICRWCGKPVAPEGAGVQYDHWIMRATSANDTEANLVPLHPACHAEKTGDFDRPSSDKARRQEKLTRPKVKKPGGFRQHPTLYRGLDGQVRERRK